MSDNDRGKGSNATSFLLSVAPMLGAWTAPRTPPSLRSHWQTITRFPSVALLAPLSL